MALELLLASFFLLPGTWEGGCDSSLMLQILLQPHYCVPASSNICYVPNCLPLVNGLLLEPFNQCLVLNCRSASCDKIWYSQCPMLSLKKMMVKMKKCTG